MVASWRLRGRFTVVGSVGLSVLSFIFVVRVGCFPVGRA